MLPEIAAEALRFLTRRDLDKASAVSKWLDALIAQCCAEYPLRPVIEVKLYQDRNLQKLDVRTEVHDSVTCYWGRSFHDVDEAVDRVASDLRHSYADCLALSCWVSQATLSQDHWKTLFDNSRAGAIRGLKFTGIDFSALGADAFLAAVHSRGLQSLEVRASIFPNGFGTGDLISLSVAQGVLQLFSANNSDSRRTLSDDVILDFFFRADAALGGRQSLFLRLQGYGVTEMFLARFLERLQSGAFRPSGELQIHGAAKQRGLSVYTQYLAPDDEDYAGATYRFPSSKDDGGNNSCYEVKHRDVTSTGYPGLRVKFGLVCRSP